MDDAIVASVDRNLLVLLSYSNKLSRSPVRPERAKCFWEQDSVTHFYDAAGQLYAIRPGNFIIRQGLHETTVAAVLLEYGFTKKNFSDGIVYNEVIFTDTRRAQQT